MSTNCNIGIKLKDNEYGIIKFSYSHYDGYPEAVGKILLMEYNDYDKALDLIMQGDMSFPGSSYNDYYSEHKETIDHRDLIEPKGIEYAYLFENGKWIFTDGENWKDLAEYLNYNLVKPEFYKDKYPFYDDYSDI